MVTTTNGNNGFARAILVSLNISSWSARKYDKKVTDDALQSHGASEDGGRFNKFLLPGTNVKRTKKSRKKGGALVEEETQAPNSFKALTQHITETRELHYRETLPWTDDGWRILPIKNYQNYIDLMNKAQHKFYALLDEFVVDYPALRAQAQVLLNGMFKADEYPEDVRKRFAFAYVPAPVPSGTDYRVELSEAEVKRLEKITEERTKQAIADAQADAVKRLLKVVSNIHERLSTEETCKNCKGEGHAVETRKKPDNGKTVTCWICDGAGKTQATYRDSLVENAREICDVLNRINMNDDETLEDLRKRTEALVANTDAQQLRDDDNLRKSTAEEAQSILDAMTATYGNLFATN